MSRKLTVIENEQQVITLIMISTKVMLRATIMLLLYLCLMMPFVVSFASYLVNKKNCDRIVEVGSIIMGQSVVFSDDKTLHVYQGQQQLLNNTRIFKSSLLSSTGADNDIIVRLDPKSTAMVLLITGATFTNGNCNGLRTTKYNSSIVIHHINNDPTNSGLQHIITLRGLWSKSYNSGVKITNPFYLYITDDDTDNASAGTSSLLDL